MVEHRSYAAARPGIRGGPGRLVAALFAVPLACLCACSGSNGPADDRADLVAQWRFDEGNGLIAKDASPNANDAALSRALWGPGHDGGALAEDGGNDDIVTVPLSASLRRTGEAITLSAWTWRDANHNVAVVSHGYPALFFGFHGQQFKWEIEHDGGARTECYADWKYVAGLGRWIHIAATYDGWFARLYADGKLICWKWARGPIVMPDKPFTVGGYLDQDGRIVDENTGRIDDVRIYSRALSSAEIRRLAEAQAAGPG